MPISISFFFKKWLSTTPPPPQPLNDDNDHYDENDHTCHHDDDDGDNNNDPLFPIAPAHPSLATIIISTIWGKAKAAFYGNNRKDWFKIISLNHNINAKDDSHRLE